MEKFIIIAGVNAFLAVALGAFGAHGLQQNATDYAVAIWDKASRYQMYHALGLFIIAFLIDKYPKSSLLEWAGWSMLGGIFLFSGSLYVMAVTGISSLGIVTPVGGLLFIAGWILTVLSLK
ncbi:MAG: hypothetical protein K0S34_717 [Bacillales bacterium]|jgi:uncharacterized membrane protein YgdD (TMEM256/DUF423 family)|nr:hypothetical protein [Bacillales bacterium]